MATFKSNFTPRPFVPKQTSSSDVDQQAVPTHVALNDPYQLNTALDVLFNTAGLKKAYGDSSFKSRIYAIGDIVKNQYWKPISQGDFGTAGINTLYGLGETLDLVGNIPKALLAPYIDRNANIDYDYARQMVSAVQDGQAHAYQQSDGTTTYTVVVNGKAVGFNNKDLKTYESVVNSGRTVNIANMTTSERFKASIGYGEYGRVNFQSDQGKGFIQDMVTELVLDPTTWVSFGASTIGKTVAGKVDDVLKVFAKQADDVIQTSVAVSERTVARELSAQLIDDTARKKIAKDVAEVLQHRTVQVESENEVLNKLMQNLLGNAVKANNVYNTYAIKDAGAAIQFVLAKRGMASQVFDDAGVMAILQRTATARVNRMTVNVLRGVGGTNDILNKTQSVLAKAAFSPTGVYPVYAIAKKAGPAVAALIMHSMKSAEDIYANAFGNRPLISYFDEDFVKERNARVNTDMLPDEAKFLYREPESLKALEAQVPMDMQRLDTWCRTINEQNAVETCAELRTYFRDAQCIELEDLPGILDKVLEKAAKLGKVSEALEQYTAYVKHMLPQIFNIEAKANMLGKAYKVDAVFRIMDEDSLLNPVVQHYRNLPESILDMLTEKDVITVVDFERVLKQQQKATLKGLRYMTDPIAKTSEAAQVYTNMLLYNCVEELAQQRAAILKELTEQFTDGKFWQEDYNFVVNGLFGKKRIEEMEVALDKHLLEYENAVLLDVDIQSTFSEFVRPQDVLDTLTSMHALYNTGLKPIMDTIKQLNKDAYKLSKIVDPSIADAKTVVPAVDDILPNFVTDVMDITESCLSLTEKFKLYVNTSDMFAPDAARTVEDEIAIYSPAGFEQLLNDFSLLPMNHKDYANMYDQVNNIIHNIQFGISKQLNTSVSTSAEAVYRGAITKPDIWYADFAQHIKDDAWNAEFTRLTKKEGVSSAEAYKACFDKYGVDVAELGNFQGSEFDSQLTALSSKLSKVQKIMQDKLQPLVRVDLVEQLGMYEDIVTIKQENFASLISIMTDEKVNQYIDNLRTGPFGNLIKDAIGNSNSIYSEEIQEYASKVNDTINSYEKMKALVYRIQMSDMRTEAKASFYSTIMKFYYITPESLVNNLGYWTDTMIKEMPKYTQYTKQYSRKFNLNSIMKDAEFKDEVDSVFKSAGMKVPDSELHLATSDTLAPLAVLYAKLKQGIPDDPKKAKEYLHIKDLVENHCLFSIDIEAMNANVKADANVIHQLGYQVQKNQKHIATHSNTVSEEVMRKFMPNRDYLLELYDAYRHDAEGVVRDNYKPLEDYTTADLQKFYIEHMTPDLAGKSEKETILDFLHQLYKDVEANAEYDPITKKYKAAIVTHNGNEFDIPALKNKINKLGLYREAAENPKYGFDLHFIDNLENVDTLEYVRKADDYFEISDAEEAAIREALLQYADGLGDGCKVFTALTTTDLNRTRKLLDLIEADKTLNKGLNAGTMQQVREQVSSAKETVTGIFNANRMLNEEFVSAELFRSPANREMWEAVMVWKMDLTAEEIEKRFGKDMSNAQLSSIFAAAGDFQTHAYTWKVQTKRLDRWFMQTLTRTVAGDVSRSEAVRLTKIAKNLDSIANSTRHYEVFAEYMPGMTESIARMLADGNKFTYMQHLRTTGLNVPETWAAFKYLASKYEDPSTLKHVLFGDMELLESQQMLLSLLEDGKKFRNLAEDKYLVDMYGDVHQKTTAYLKQLQDMLNLRTSFEGMSHFTDNKGLLGGAALIQMKAMEPMTNVMSSLYTAIKKMARPARLAFYDREQKLTNQLARQITKQFIDAPAEDTLKWLAYSKGHAVLNILSFEKQGGIDAYTAFIDKLDSQEFKALNIHHVESGDSVWVYLTKDADMKMRVDLETGKKTAWVNGAYIEDVTRSSFDANSFADIYEGVVDSAELQRAIDAADFMTDGSVRGTLYDIYNKDTFEKLYTQMPEEMQKEFYAFKDFSGPEFWDGSSHNRSILGEIGDRRKYGVGHSGQFISGLRNATEYKLHEHGVRLVYVQSMFSDANALQNSRIGALIGTDPHNVAKWFKSNQDYTAAVLVEDKLHKQGYKIIECDMSTAAGVRKALEMNAKVVSYSEYNKLYEVINSNVFSETQLRGWQKIMRMFKIGYLANPGTWGRNGMDAFIKNIEATGENAPAMAMHYATAAKTLSDYDYIVNDLCNNFGKGHFPTPSETEAYFKGCSKMNYEEFKQLHSFFSDPAAGSESRLFTQLNTKSRKRYLEQLQQSGAITTDEYIKQQNRMAYNGITNALLSPMNGVERLARLASFQALSKQGLSSNTALRIVEQTHFAYSTKSQTEQVLEMLIPFYTFTSRNFVYWMEVLDNNANYLAKLRDVLDPALNLDQYSPGEVEENNALQRSILSGNIKVTDDYYWSMSLSFMDALKWLTNPVAQAKGSTFTPVQAFVNVWLQNAADENYLSGQEALSNWMQNTFGLKITKEQVEAKYGAWAAEYIRLHDYRISNLDPTESVLHDFKWLQLVPLIGSQLQRLETTGVYYDEGDGLKSLLYAAGFAGKVNRWEDVAISKDVNQGIYPYLQNEDTRNIYTRLKDTLGYKGIPLADLPLNVKETILALLQGTVPSANTIPVLQDGDAISFMWTALKRQYDVAGTNFADIDKDVLTSMYKDVAASVTRIGNMYEMLSTDPASRISYSILKKNLGLEGLKIYQMPLDALEVMEFAMQKHLYGTGYSKKSYSSNTQYRKRSYATKTYAKGGNSPGYFGGYSGQTPYDTSKGVYANYGHTSVQKQQYNDRTNFYEDHYAQSGVSRMKMSMIPITPENLPSRTKDMFYYYR